MKIKKVILILFVALLLFPPESLAAYPPGSRTNIDTGGHIKIVGSSGSPGAFDWNSDHLRPTMKYRLVNPNIPGTYNDYMYESNWFVSINGTNSSKRMVLMRPRSDGGSGRTLAQPGDVLWWGKELNGNPQYVQRQFGIQPTRVINVHDGSTANRAYSRDLGEWTGATLDIQGTGQRDDGPDGNFLEMATVRYTTTKFPDPKITVPSSATAGSSITIGLTGTEFYPHTYYSTRPAITYELKINGKVLKTDTKQASTFTDSHVIAKGVCVAGTYDVELSATDIIERTTVVKSTITITGSATGCDDIGPPGGGGGTPGGGSCSFVIVPGGDGGSVVQNVASPNPNGSISSDNGVFDVIQGIPTSEYLRVTANSQEYLVDQMFNQKTGKVEYEVPVTQDAILNWIEEATVGGVVVKTPKTETIQKPPIMVKVERPWTYWQIGTYTIHKWMTATFTNYALPGGSVTIPTGSTVSASGNHSPGVDSHVFPAPCVEIVLPPETVTGGATKPPAPPIDASQAKSMAEGQIAPPNVKNDQATFNGSAVMDDSEVLQNGPTPSQVPYPGVLTATQGGLLIDNSKVNNYRTPSTGLVTYEEVVNINGTGGDRTFPFSVNDVTVHTPVVIYARASDDKEHDQRTSPPTRSTPPDPNADRHAFILDRPFTVDLPTTGQHRNIPGYGFRDYAKYIKNKQVSFPFDVYSSNKSVFYPANVWIDVPVSQERIEFFLPVWVPEGEYTTLFRVFAINAPNINFGTEHEANITIPNPIFNIPPAGTNSAAHAATDSIEIDVVGRLYDFKVTDIKDYNWKDVFREADGVTPKGTKYWVGLDGIDGDPRGIQPPYTLPIRQGSHPGGYRNVSVKTGYSFSFDMKTKGNMFGLTDGIRIKPSFYFVNKDGTGRQEVDLYYNTKVKKFVKIGSADDKTHREIELNKTSRNVPFKQLVSNADYYYRHATQFNLTDPLVMFPHSYSYKYINKDSKKGVVTGPYGWQVLNWKLRGYMGPDVSQVPVGTMIPEEDIVAREQTWYGEYSIPAESYVVRKGTVLENVSGSRALNKNHPVFLKDGYIIVNFDIESIRDGDTNNPYLQYINAPLINQWYGMEGYARSFVDPYGHTFNLLDGDVVFYHGDASSLDDHGPSVTH